MLCPFISLFYFPSAKFFQTILQFGTPAVSQIDPNTAAVNALNRAGVWGALSIFRRIVSMPWRASAEANIRLL